MVEGQSLRRNSTASSATSGAVRALKCCACSAIWGKLPTSGAFAECVRRDVARGDARQPAAADRFAGIMGQGAKTRQHEEKKR